MPTPPKCRFTNIFTERLTRPLHEYKCTHLHTVCRTCNTRAQCVLESSHTGTHTQIIRNKQIWSIWKDRFWFWYGSKWSTVHTAWINLNQSVFNVCCGYKWNTKSLLVYFHLSSYVQESLCLFLSDASLITELLLNTLRLYLVTHQDLHFWHGVSVCIYSPRTCMRHALVVTWMSVLYVSHACRYLGICGVRERRRRNIPLPLPAPDISSRSQIKPGGYLERLRTHF